MWGIGNSLKPVEAPSFESLWASWVTAVSWKEPRRWLRGHMVSSCAIQPRCQRTSLSLSVFFVKWEVWILQVSPLQLWNRRHHEPYLKDYQRWFSPRRKRQGSGVSCLEFQLGSLTGVRVNKLFIKNIPQKCSPTCLSHSENRKPTPISSEDHPMCPPPSTSCKNVFMKSPQSQGQRAAPCGWGGTRGQEAHRQLTRRKINSRVGQAKEETTEETCPERSTA